MLGVLRLIQSPPSLRHFVTQGLLPSALCGSAGMWLLPARVWLCEDLDLIDCVQ